MEQGPESKSGIGHQEDVEVMDAVETKPITLEGLLEENQALKATLEKKDDKIKKQQRTLRALKRFFTGDDWNTITKRHKTLERLLPELLKEEERLIEIVEGLKQTMHQAGKAVREKEEEARKLVKKLARLEEGSLVTNLKGAAKDNQVTTHSDGRLVVDILPEEVWKIILGEVSDPKDLWNCCNTCQLFETLLRPWKTGWMLEQALPHLYRHLPGSKLLECRQVSRGWYAGVSGFLDNHPSTKSYSDEDSDPRRLDVVYPVKEKEIGSNNFLNFGPDEDLSRLHELFPNPFIGRYVGLDLREPDRPEDEVDLYDVEEERWAKLYSFFEAYGKEIWHLALYFPLQPGPRTVDKICELLTSKLFPLVPNLRKLFITETGCGFGIDVPIDHEALPPAPGLKILQVGPVAEDKVVDSLIRRYHLQLEGLHVSESTWQFVRHLDWPRLKDFAIYLRDVDWEVDLGNLSGLTIPLLSRLTLRMDDFIHLDLPSLAVAINGLTFTTPLNVIRLAGPLHRIQFGQGRQTPAPFVHWTVKTLELVDHWSQAFRSQLLPCHNFLLCFPLIENLTVIVRKASSYMDILEGRFETESDLMPDEEWKSRAAGLDPVDEFVEVNKYAYKGQMYKSNIWVLLPRLKVLTFQWDVYTREEYEATRGS